jgi:hypothetical protein
MPVPACQDSSIFLCRSECLRRRQAHAGSAFCTADCSVTARGIGADLGGLPGPPPPGMRA